MGNSRSEGDEYRETLEYLWNIYWHSLSMYELPLRMRTIDPPFSGIGPSFTTQSA